MSVIIEIFRVLATLMNLVLYLSPLPTVRTIHRTKNTGHMPFVPLAAMASNCYIWMMYGYLARDYVALFSSCAFGVIVSIGYVTVYIRYSTERAYAWQVIAIFALVLSILTIYIIIGLHGLTSQPRDQVRLTVGYVAISSSVVMYTSPLEKIRQVFRYRSGVFIPIHIVVVGSVNAVSWVVYSALVSDWLVFVPNTLLLLITLAQIALYRAFHPAKHPLPPSADKSLDATVSLEARSLN